MKYECNQKNDSRIVVTPGSGVNDVMLSTNFGINVKIVYTSDNEISQLSDVTVYVENIKTGGMSTSDIMAKINRDYTLDETKKILTTYCFLAVKNGPLKNKLTFDVKINVQGALAQPAFQNCTIDVIDNSIFPAAYTRPQIAGGSVAIDTMPIKFGDTPLQSHKHVDVVFQPIDENKNKIPNTYITMGVDGDSKAMALLNHTIVPFIKNNDGTTGEYVPLNQNRFNVGGTLKTDSNGMVVVSFFGTNTLTQEIGVQRIEPQIEIKENVYLSSSKEVIVFSKMDFITDLESPKIESESTNIIEYDELKSGVYVKIPEYSDVSDSDRIVILNKNYNQSDEYYIDVANSQAVDRDIFKTYKMFVSYQDMSPNTWNLMNYFVFQDENVRRSMNNLYMFKSPKALPVDPPEVERTLKIPELIFESDDQTKTISIGTEQNVVLISEYVNFGGSLTLKVYLNGDSVSAGSVVSAQVFIDAFEEGSHDSKRTSIDLFDNMVPLPTVTDADLANEFMEISVSQDAFKFYDNDKFGEPGMLWISVQVGTGIFAKVFWSQIDTVAPGD